MANRSPAEIYRWHFLHDPRRERLFLSSLSFLVTFAAVRGITHAIRARRGPFRNLAVGTTHLHHLVFGIVALLGVGYLWLVQIGTGVGSRASKALSVGTAALYGLGSALTLDEFALWLNLEDDYWTSKGRESIDAVVVFGGTLSVGAWGGPFFRSLMREALRPFRRGAPRANDSPRPPGGA